MNAYALDADHVSGAYMDNSAPIDKETWDNIAKVRRRFIETGEIDPQSGYARPEVLDSWARCMEMGIDPDATKLANSISDSDLDNILNIYSDIIEAARPLIGMVDELGLSNDYIFELISRNGVTILRTGNMDLHPIVAKQSSMNESTMGTNAHTLCMKYARPMQLLGPEHFCSALHRLAAIAAPVFDKNGLVVGSMLLTQPLPENPWSKDYQKLLSHALGFIASICSALEHQLVFQDSLAVIADVDERLERAEAFGKRAAHVLDIAVGSSGDPILIMDNKGIVQHASPEAIHLLRTTMSDVVGRPIDDTLDLKWPEDFEPLMESQGVEITTKVGSKLLGVRGNAVRNGDGGTLDGSVARISEVQKAKASASGRSGEVATITFDDILGTSVAIREAVSLAHRYAMTSENVLIIGESGTGKEYFAQAIHNASRANGSFMSVNCAAIPPRLIESELFGYESGAFTGADKAGKPGKIELADGGTLFLDEIGDMPLELQATLLRVLENKSVMRLGGKSYRKVDFRVVAATNRSLPKMVEDGLFREDLLYRLSILTVNIPPLRMRNGDTMFFAYYYLNECRRKAFEGPSRFEPDVERLISEFPWPGNVRQIKNAIYSAFYAAVNDEIGIADLPQYLRDGNAMPYADFDGLSYAAKYTPDGLEIQARSEEEAQAEAAGSQKNLVNDKDDDIVRDQDVEDPVLAIPEEMLRMDAVEEAAIRLALTYAKGNVSEAAKILQISKATLYRKIKEYKLK